MGDQPLSLGRPVEAPAGATVALALRPQAVTLGPGSGSDVRLRATVADVSFLGSVVRVRVGLDDQRLSLDLFNNAALRPPVVGEEVEIGFGASDVLVYCLTREDSEWPAAQGFTDFRSGWKRLEEWLESGLPLVDKA